MNKIDKIKPVLDKHLTEGYGIWIVEDEKMESAINSTGLVALAGICTMIEHYVRDAGCSKERVLEWIKTGLEE